MTPARACWFGRGPLTLLLLLVVTMTAMMMTGVEASCAEAGRCCEGKDNECRGVVVYSNTLRLENLLYGNVSKKACFCDSACAKLGDCCSDYRDHCPRELSFLYGLLRINYDRRSVAL